MPTQDFPKQLVADIATRSGRMLSQGDVRVTVTDKHTDEHITIRFKALLDNRPGEHGLRAKPEHSRNWIRVPLREATHVFIEVPSATGNWPDKVGSFYPRTGAFYVDQVATPERLEAANIAARWLNEGEQQTRNVGRYMLQEEPNCGVCGKSLNETDEIEMDRGICSRCYGKMEEPVQSKTKLSSEEQTLVDEILAACADLSEPAQHKIHHELSMWFQ